MLIAQVSPFGEPAKVIELVEQRSGKILMRFGGD